MTTTTQRLITANLDAALLERLRALPPVAGLTTVTARTEADLLTNTVEGRAVVALGLRNPGISPALALKALALARSRPAIVLVGAIDPRVLEDLRQLASDLRLDSIVHVPSIDEAAGMIAALVDSEPSPDEPTEAELRQAIEEGELTLHYQPKFTCGEQRALAGVEALVRWHHPTLGFLRPGRFLPLAERAALLMDVTDFTIVEAIRQHAAWRARGHDIPVSVNLAPGLVRDGGFPERLLTSLRQFGVEPARVTLEVRETERAIDRALCRDVFLRLRKAGVGLALDDFGSGLSSLTELSQLPFSELKLDRTLVAEAPVKGEQRIVMRGIVRLAHELGISVCAEGVETRAELNGILAAGCDAAQGMLLGEPQTPAEFERSLSARRARTVIAPIALPARAAHAVMAGA